MLESSRATVRRTARMLNMLTLATLQVGAGTKSGLGSNLLGDMTGATEVLFGVLIIDEELAVLAVAVGFVASDGDNVEYVTGLVKDRVHFFQRAVCGLGVEEVDHRKDDGVALGSVSGVKM